MKFFIVLLGLIAFANAYSYSYYNQEAEPEQTRWKRSYAPAGKHGGGLTHWNGPHCKSLLVGCAPIVQKVPCKGSAGGYGGHAGGYGGHAGGHAGGHGDAYLSAVHKQPQPKPPQKAPQKKVEY